MPGLCRTLLDVPRSRGDTTLIMPIPGSEAWRDLIGLQPSFRILSTVPLSLLQEEQSWDWDLVLSPIYVASWPLCLLSGRHDA